MTKMEILLKITPAVLIVRKLTLKTGGKRQNRQSLLLFIQKSAHVYVHYANEKVCDVF